MQNNQNQFGKPTLTQEQRQFYRDLNAVVSDKFINDMLVKYGQMEYNKAIAVLRGAKDPHAFAKAQGEADAWERLINVKDFVAKILANSK